MMMSLTLKRILAILFLTYYLVGVKAVKNSKSSINSDDEETLEISDEDDTYSLEELTTVTNHIPLTLPVQQQQTLHEANPPIQKQIATVLEMITQTSSPLLMKLIAPTSDFTESTIEIPTERPISLSDGSNDSSEAESGMFILKKARLLPAKSPSSSAVERAKNADSDISDNTMEDTTTIADADLDVENNETNIDTAEEVITTTVPSPPLSSTSKRPSKNIEILKKKPDELLQNYVEDGHLRSPIAALVDKKSNPLNKAKRLWKAALRPNSLLDILVVSYDSEGIKSTYNLTNTKAMMSTLDKVREENATDQESKTYYSIIRTGQLIPFDSAIFLSTDDLPNDTEHQLQASMFLLKKRIRLYLIIFDKQNLSMSAETTHASMKNTGFLGQLAMITGGDIIYVPNYAFQSDGDMGYITLVRRNKLKNIDQEPLKEVHENELRNETETLIAASKEDSYHSLESQEYTSDNNN